MNSVTMLKRNKYKIIYMIAQELYSICVEYTQKFDLCENVLKILAEYNITDEELKKIKEDETLWYLHDIEHVRISINEKLSLCYVLYEPDKADRELEEECIKYAEKIYNDIYRCLSNCDVILKQ